MFMNEDGCNGRIGGGGNISGATDGIEMADVDDLNLITAVTGKITEGCP